MKTENDLKILTKKFFRNYWNPTNGQPPSWSEHWHFHGQIPKSEKRGCYALFKNEEIIYIGVGMDIIIKTNIIYHINIHGITTLVLARNSSK
jgi:hypothetical protein